MASTSYIVEFIHVYRDFPNAIHPWLFCQIFEEKFNTCLIGSENKEMLIFLLIFFIIILFYLICVDHYYNTTSNLIILYKNDIEFTEYNV